MSVEILDTLRLAGQWLAAALLLLSAFFLLVGAIGLVRLPDFFMRLHAPTKASTLGVGGMLVAGMILSGLDGRIGFAEVLITLFLFVTAPVSANLMAQAALHLRQPSQAPLPEGAVPERRADAEPRNPIEPTTTENKKP
jgi:multicomponent K+:H+ antiporter subunit G